MENTERNETDPNSPHHFQIRGYIVRIGPGRGIRYGNCTLCDNWEFDPVHNYIDPFFSAAEEKMNQMKEKEALKDPPVIQGSDVFTSLRCVYHWYVGRQMAKCVNDGTILVGAGFKDWKVCPEHTSIWRPTYMPTWWYWTSLLILASMTSIVLFIFA